MSCPAHEAGAIPPRAVSLGFEGFFRGLRLEGPEQMLVRLLCYLSSRLLRCLLMKDEFPFAREQSVDAAAEGSDCVLLAVPTCGGLIDQDARILRWGEDSLIRETHLSPAPILTILFAYGSDRSVSRDYPCLLE